MKSVILFVLLLGSLFGKDRFWAVYGTKPENELTIRYIDTQKKGFFKELFKKGFEVKETENTQINEGLYLHTMSLAGRVAGEIIRFKIGLSEEVYTVATLKKDNLKFLIAGDIYRNVSYFKEGIACIKEEDPDFVIMGGDLAYSTHGPSLNPLKRHLAFIDELSANLFKKDGRVIPIMVACGNHDYKKGSDEWTPLFYFPPFSKSYRKYDLRGLDLWILDTGHIEKIEGLQLNFLEETLKSSDKGIKLCVYHMGAYPAYYDFNSEHATHVRQTFVPLFDKYGVKGCFEHHSHCFKVTKKIKNNKVDEEGCIYFGDGCFGVKPREPVNKAMWYIDKAEKSLNYYILKLSQDRLTILAKNFKKEAIFEEIQIDSR
jgi:hypothetical protein